MSKMKMEESVFEATNASIAAWKSGTETFEKTAEAVLDLSSTYLETFVRRKLSFLDVDPGDTTMERHYDNLRFMMERRAEGCGTNPRQAKFLNNFSCGAFLMRYVNTLLPKIRRSNFGCRLQEETGRPSNRDLRGHVSLDQENDTQEQLQCAAAVRASSENNPSQTQGASLENLLEDVDASDLAVVEDLLEANDHLHKSGRVNHAKMARNAGLSPYQIKQWRQRMQDTAAANSDRFPDHGIKEASLDYRNPVAANDDQLIPLDDADIF